MVTLILLFMTVHAFEVDLRGYTTQADCEAEKENPAMTLTFTVDHADNTSCMSHSLIITSTSKHEDRSFKITNMHPENPSKIDFKSFSSTDCKQPNEEPEMSFDGMVFSLEEGKCVRIHQERIEGNENYEGLPEMTFYFRPFFETISYREVIPPPDVELAEAASFPPAPPAASRNLEIDTNAMANYQEKLLNELKKTYVDLKQNDIVVGTTHELYAVLANGVTQDALTKATDYIEKRSVTTVNPTADDGSAGDANATDSGDDTNDGRHPTIYDPSGKRGTTPENQDVSGGVHLDSNNVRIDVPDTNNATSITICITFALATFVTLYA